MADDRLRIHNSPTFSNPRLVVGFSGWMDGGDVSTGTIRILAEKLVDPSALVMGATAENLHDRVPHITKARTDAFGLASQQKTAKAYANGKLQGDLVPVGKDQEAHVNMTRDLAQRFNSLYGASVFPITQPLLTETARVPGLDGIERKMSKSAGNYIALSFDEAETTGKIKSMFTDPVKIRKDDPGHPDGCVVYAFHGIYDRETQGRIRTECETGARGCVACKMQLAERMNAALRPIRERRRELEAEPGRVREILSAGADRARAVAAETMREVREAMNIPTRENV